MIPSTSKMALLPTSPRLPALQLSAPAPSSLTGHMKLFFFFVLMGVTLDVSSPSWLTVVSVAGGPASFICLNFLNKNRRAACFSTAFQSASPPVGQIAKRSPAGVQRSPFLLYVGVRCL